MTSKIDVNAIMKHSEVVNEHKLIGNLKVFQTVLLRQLPPERSNGLISLIYATRPSATFNEIQSALVEMRFSSFSKSNLTLKTQPFVNLLTELFVWLRDGCTQCQYPR